VLPDDALRLIHGIMVSSGRRMSISRECGRQSGRKRGSGSNERTDRLWPTNTVLHSASVGVAAALGVRFTAKIEPACCTTVRISVSLVVLVRRRRRTPFPHPRRLRLPAPEKLWHEPTNGTDWQKRATEGWHANLPLLHTPTRAAMLEIAWLYADGRKPKGSLHR
jgi:hypothetical protein